MSKKTSKLVVSQPDGTVKVVELDRAIDAAEFLKELGKDVKWTSVPVCQPRAWPGEEEMTIKITDYEYDNEGNIVAFNVIILDEEE